MLYRGGDNIIYILYLSQILTRRMDPLAFISQLGTLYLHILQQNKNLTFISQHRNLTFQLEQAPYWHRTGILLLYLRTGTLLFHLEQEPYFYILEQEPYFHILEQEPYFFIQNRPPYFYFYISLLSYSTQYRSLIVTILSRTRPLLLYVFQKRNSTFSVRTSKHILEQEPYI